MKITIEFESWEEMESFRNPGASSTVKTQIPEPQPAAQEDMVSQPEEKPAEPAEDPQDLMVKARQLLADVNKATGMNNFYSRAPYGTRRWKSEIFFAIPRLNFQKTLLFQFFLL